MTGVQTCALPICNVLDGPEPMTNDEISNALLGIKTLYEMKFNELFNTFEQLVHDKKII